MELRYHMLQPTSVRRLALLCFLALAGAAGGKPSALAPRALPGWVIYDKFCLSCHGGLGDGRGPAAPYTWGRPRAFTAGNYEWRSTGTGQPPTDDDLRMTIRFGAGG